MGVSQCLHLEAGPPVIYNEMSVFYVLSSLLVFAALPDNGEGKHLHVYAFKTMNWYEAFEYCRRLNKNLVSIMNKKEHEELANAMHTCGKTCSGNDAMIEHSWTAGTDLDQEQPGTFRYVWKTNGQPLDNNLFAPDHPPDNFEGEERCIEAFDIPRENQVVLNDCPCLRTDTQYVVCQEE